MRKVLAVIAVAALVSVASSWAAVVTNVLEKNNITIKGKLSPAKTAVTEASLAVTNGVPVSWLLLQIVTGPTTNGATAASTNIVVTGQTMTLTGPVTTNSVSTNTANGAITTTMISTNAASTNTISGLGWVVTITTAGTNTITASTTTTNDVIGQITTNGVATNAVVCLTETAGVDLTKGKYVDVFTGTAGLASKASLLVSSTWKTKATSTTTNTTISGKIQGLWIDGTNAVAGTIKSAK